MRSTSVALKIVVLLMSAESFVFGKKDDHCDSQYYLEDSQELISNCSQRSHHLVCWSGLPHEFISSFKSMRSLTLCDWPETFFDPEEVLKNFASLKKFTLSGGKLANLTSSFPAKAEALEHITLINTRLVELPVDAFANLENLRILDLRNNKLRNVSPRHLNSSRLKYIYLSDNPWKCDENISWILDTRHNALGKRISDRDKMHCGVPYEGRPLVPVVEIIITLKEECKRTVCNCELVYVVGRVGRHIQRQLMAFVTANCSYRGLTEMPTFLPANTTTLHLKGNKISDLTPLAVNPVYKQVIDLYIDDNFVESITNLEGSNWLDHFRVFSLQGNRLTDLPTYALENVLLQSGSAVSIYLGNNPWRCDCLFTPGFQDLLIRYPNIFKDVNNVRCHSVVNEQNLNKQIRDLTRTEICVPPSSVSWLNPLDVLNIILASLIVIIVGKLLYDWWSFKKTGKLPWIVAKIP